MPAASPITLLGLGLGNFKQQFNALPKFIQPAVRKFSDRYLPGSGLSTNFANDLSKHLGRKVSLFDAETLTPSIIKKHKDFFGPNASIVNLGTPVSGIKQKVLGQPIATAAKSKLWENKALEAKFLEGIIPDTSSLPALAKEFGINLRSRGAGQQILDAARQKYGDKFLFKPITSHQSSPSLFPTHKTAPGELLKTLRGGILNNSGDTLGRGTRNWVVQKKFDLKEPSLFDKFLKFTSIAGTGAREYRVHAVGHKVIPYGSTYRGSLRMGLPYYTKEHALVEKEMQNLLNSNLKKEHRNVPFAFDVLIGKNGKIIPIESNPATLDGASGLAALPHVTDAAASFVAGKTPLYILRQRAIENAASNAANSALNSAGVIAPSLYRATRDS